MDHIVSEQAIKACLIEIHARLSKAAQIAKAAEACAVTGSAAEGVTVSMDIEQSSFMPPRPAARDAASLLNRYPATKRRPSPPRQPRRVRGLCRWQHMMLSLIPKEKVRWAHLKSKRSKLASPVRKNGRRRLPEVQRTWKFVAGLSATTSSVLSKTDVSLTSTCNDEVLKTGGRCLAMLRQPKGTHRCGHHEGQPIGKSIRSAGSWQGVVKKKLKLKLATEKRGDERDYRIAKGIAKAGAAA